VQQEYKCNFKDKILKINHGWNDPGVPFHFNTQYTLICAKRYHGTRIGALTVSDIFEEV
jgi:hypothetical protein